MQKQEQSNGDAAFRWCPGSSSRSINNVFEFVYRTSTHTQVENGNFRPSIRFLEHHSVTSPPNNQEEVCTQWKIITALIALVSQVAPVVKNPPANAGNIRDMGPWVGGFPREGNGNTLQYSCLENPHGWRSFMG